MNEKEYEIFKEKYADLKKEIDTTPIRTTPEGLMDIHMAITSFSPVIADIARQLTRIADQGEPKPERELARHQPCGCILCTCYGDDQCRGCGAISCCKDDCVLKTSKGIIFADDPTPDVPTDVLVEAVILFFANEGISTPTLVSAPQSFKVKTESLKILYSALAAHEKAVR